MLTAEPIDIPQVRRTALTADPDQESLLHILLVKQAFSDTNFQFVERAIDSSWRYRNLVPISVTGFNPFEGAYYYGRNSRFALWLQNPFASAREINENDLLVREVLFMAHDYLHAWTYQAIDRLHPEIGVLSGQITTENIEDYAFCHLVTEAVATVGLDYWLLSERNVNSFCNIGSTQGPLTVGYREALLPEYRRFHPELRVQTPEFFKLIAEFYCTGEFPGFDAEDISRSHLLLNWLQHELTYGVTQRVISRSWLVYLAGDRIDLPAGRMDVPLDVDSDFRRMLLDELSELLWEKVKEWKSPADDAWIGPWRKAAARTSPAGRAADLRFLNLSMVSRENWPADGDREGFGYFLNQYLSRIPLSTVPQHRLKYLPLLRSECNPRLVDDLFGDLPALVPGPGETRDLLIAN